MSARRHLHHRKDEQGAFLVIWALLLVALLTMVAIVVDLGQLRAARRTNKSIADFAVLAAGPNLAVSNPRGACKDALKNIRANALRPELSSITQGEIDTTCGDPLDPSTAGLPQSCPSPIPASSPTQTLTKGKYVIRISSPVVDADIADPRLTGGAGLADGAPCQRLRVEITETADTHFAGVIGVHQQTTTVASVIRGSAESKSEKVAALLVLERTDCQALWTSGQGNVLVRKAGPSDPGILHADSFGTTNCSGSTSQAYVIYGTSVPSGNPRAGQPSIQVEGPATSPPTPCPGGGVHRGFLNVIFPFSATAASVVDSGVCPAPTGGGITGRRFHEQRYNPTGDPTRTQTINKLRADSIALVTPVPATTLAQTMRNRGYVVFPDDGADPIKPLLGPSGIATGPITGGCTTNTTYVITNARVFINCDPLNATNLTFTGTHFTTAGALRVGSTNTLRFPNAAEIVVKGCTAGNCKGNTTADSGIDINNGIFTINDGTATTCVSADPVVLDREGTAPTVLPARLVILKGRLSSVGANALIRMCQTTVYMADGGPSPQHNTGGHPSCAAVPCPLTNDFTGDVKTQGRIVDWSAPNQSSTLPAADAFPGPFEDLALWSEAGGSTGSFDNNSKVGGNSTTSTSGVFFLPNGLFEFNGKTDISQEFNAQFVARRLNLNGLGVLTMVPNPFDAVPTPFPSWRLIR